MLEGQELACKDSPVAKYSKRKIMAMDYNIFNVFFKSMGPALYRKIPPINYKGVKVLLLSDKT